MDWPVLASTILKNDRIVLRPLAAEDRQELCGLAMDDEIWRYFVTRIRTEAEFDAFFDAAIADQRAGRRVAYLVVDRPTGRAAGSMSFGNFAEVDRRLEIGWSWLGRDFRGRGINHWTKALMLEHAFDRLGAERVEFKTDVLNVQARRALRNIGAVEEGILRSYNPMPGGRRRDAVFYSVLRAEWPAVRERLCAGPTAKVSP